MGFYKRFRLLKMVMLMLFAANSFVLAWAAMMVFNYYNGQDQVSLSVENYIFLALATLIMGFVLPFFVFRQLAITLQNLRTEAEKNFVTWMNWWTKNYVLESTKSSEPFYQKPHFWMNIFLMFVESMAPQSRHPFVGYLGELAPVLRSELNKELAKGADVNRAS